MILREITEESLDHLTLLFCEVGDVIKFMEVSQVLKHLVCGSHVLIQIIEIG